MRATHNSSTQLRCSDKADIPSHSGALVTCCLLMFPECLVIRRLPSAHPRTLDLTSVRTVNLLRTAQTCRCKPSRSTQRSGVMRSGWAHTSLGIVPKKSAAAVSRRRRKQTAESYDLREVVMPLHSAMPSVMSMRPPLSSGQVKSPE